MDSLEKHDAGEIPDGYVVSRCCSAITDLCQSLYSSVDHLIQEETAKENGSTGKENVGQALFSSAFKGVFPSIGILLNSSTDETVIDQLLCSISMIISMGFRLRSVEETQAALYMMGAASTPTGEYLSTFGFLKPPPSCEGVLTDCTLPSQKVVALGAPCPSPFVAPESWNQQTVVSLTPITSIWFSDDCEKSSSSQSVAGSSKQPCGGDRRTVVFLSFSKFLSCFKHIPFSSVSTCLG